MDVFDLMVLGFITASGSGLIRDVSLNNVPVAFTDNHYFLAALISTRFAVTGVVIGSNEMLSWAPCIALRMVTVTGGGILLDILASRISKVLSTQPNVSGSLIGQSVN